MTRIIGVLMLVAIIGSSTLGITLTSTQVTMDLQIDAEWERTTDLIELAVASMNAANRSLTFSMEQQLNATLVVAARYTYQQGIAALSAANTTLYAISSISSTTDTQSNHTFARQLAVDAMHLFKATIEQLVGLWEDPEVFESYRTLVDSIRRLGAYHTRLQTLILKAKTAFPYYNYSKIDSTLHQVKIHLTWAKQNVTAFQLDTARSEVEQANHTLSIVTAQIQSAAAALEVKKERVLQFINRSLANLNRTFFSLAQDTGQDITTEAAQINETIETAKQRLAMNNISGAITAVLDAYRLLIDNIAKLMTYTTP